MYVSQHVLSLGTSVGVLNALLLNGNISFASISSVISEGKFQPSGLLNDLLMKWNSCNMCIIAATMMQTIELNIEEVNRTTSPRLIV